MIDLLNDILNIVISNIDNTSELYYAYILSPSELSGLLSSLSGANSWDWIPQLMSVNVWCSLAFYLFIITFIFMILSLPFKIILNIIPSKVRTMKAIKKGK